MTEGIVASTAPVVDTAPPSLLWRLAPVAVALVTLLLGAVALGHRSLSSDEAAAFAQSRGSLGDVLSTVVRDEPASAGHVLLVKAASTVSVDEVAIRAPSVIATALAAGLLVLLGTMLLGRLEGLVAGIALAANAGVIEASREARPYALGLAGVVIATLLFVIALQRGGAWRWAAYGMAAALLPLTHPLAASVIAAHGAALIACRERPDVRRAGIAMVGGTVVAGVLLAWMAADRLDAAPGAGTLDLERLARGLGLAGGWNAFLLAGAIAGLAALFTARGRALGLWRGVLVAALIAAPVAVTLVAAIGLPVHAGALVLCAPGLALATGAAVMLVPVSERAVVVAGLAALLIASVAIVGVRAVAPPAEDWRALAQAVKRVRDTRETVVVVPDRSRAAFTYYAPYVTVIERARGDGAWLAVVARTPVEAVTAARPWVRTPTYALRRQFRYGDELRLQHWVRP